MNQYILFAILAVVVFVFWTFIKNSNNAGGTRITPSDAKKRLATEKGIILLDVRTRDEYLEKHIPQSTLIPVDVLANESSRKLPNKNSEIIVYCRGGNRSAMAVKTLSKLGYTNVHNLGGIVRWPYETVSGNR